MPTSIEWTDESWNPVRGCAMVSPGCTNCYAMRQAARMGGPGGAYEGLTRSSSSGPLWTGRATFVQDMLGAPLRWRRPRRVFVNSMSDLFHDDLTDHEIAAIFGVMAASPRHVFQILTKRAQRMERWFEWVASQSDGTYMDPPSHVCYRAARRALPAGEAAGVDGATMAWPLPNVWMGVSVEDQRRADERIPPLLRTQAAVRFVSYEPALESVDFTRLHAGPYDHLNALTATSYSTTFGWVNHSDIRPLSWVICGGESGPRARPFDLGWARATVAACRAAGVACFIKQLGSNPLHVRRAVEPCGLHQLPGCGCDDGLLSDRKGGDPSEWDEGLRVREWPQSGDWRP